MSSNPLVITTILGGRVTQKSEFIKERVMLGRSAECDLRFDNVGVSRVHAVITRKEGAFFLEDLESSNGTFVNGKRERLCELRNGDMIQIGKFMLHVGMSEAGAGSDAALSALLRDERTVQAHTPSSRAPSAPRNKSPGDSTPH